MNLLTRFGIMAQVVGIPNGATATPIDDYTTWLSCAEIPDTFGSLTNVIASTTARDTLCNNLNALRYMVRSTSIIMPAVLANSGWITALDSSTYSAKIPTMTSNTAPSGIARSKSNAGAAYIAYKALDKSQVTSAQPPIVDATFWVEYEFAAGIVPYKITVTPGNSSGSVASIVTYKFQGSDDGTNYYDITGSIATSNLALYPEATLTPTLSVRKIFRYQGISCSNGAQAVILYEMNIFGLNLN